MGTRNREQRLPPMKWTCPGRTFTKGEDVLGGQRSDVILAVCLPYKVKGMNECTGISWE